MWEVNTNYIFKETEPYINFLNSINQNGFKTESSQPGHLGNNYDPNEHTYRNGYGYIQGYVHMNDIEIIDKLLRLTRANYTIIVQNNVYCSMGNRTFSMIPHYPIGADTPVPKIKNIPDPEFIYDHPFPNKFRDDHLYVCVRATELGCSNIFEDVASSFPVSG